MREAFLEALSPDMPGAIRDLQDYRFSDPQAQRMFDGLMEHLREQVMGAYFRSMAEGLRDLSDEQVRRFRDMLAELNEMIERRERDEPYDFDGFMERYGDLFPDDPNTLDELLENMARRMAAMSRLMASMSPEQRAELQALAEQVMQDMDLAFEVDRLSSNLTSMFPGMGWDGSAPGDGEGASPLSATVDAMELDLQRESGGGHEALELGDAHLLDVHELHVARHHRDHAFNHFVRIAQAAQDRFGHPGADGIMAVEAGAARGFIPLAGGGLGDVVQQDREAQVERGIRL